MSATPRTNKAAYQYPQDCPSEDRDGHRYCNLLNESRQLERELAEANAENSRLADQVNDLEMKLDGYEKCEQCKGDGGGYSAYATPRPDPQTWVDCNNCDGEGWVK